MRRKESGNSKDESFNRHFFLVLGIFGLGNGSSNVAEVKAQANKKVYTIATDTSYAPFEFLDGEGNLIGIAIDILAAIAKDQGFEYELMTLPFSFWLTSFRKWTSRWYDCWYGNYRGKRSSFDFTNPYFQGGSMFAVAANSEIEAIEYLSGQKVAVKITRTGEAIANELSGEFGFDTTTFEYVSRRCRRQQSSSDWRCDCYSICRQYRSSRFTFNR